MALASYDGQFGSKQETIARLGQDYKASRKPKTAEEYDRMMNSPFMKGQQNWENICAAKASARDKMRMKTDKSFKPSDSDWTAKPTYDFDVLIDYYRVLGVDEYETQEDIKKAYRRLSLVYHPDKAAGMPRSQAEEYQGIFIEINNAYLVLSDNPTRRQYDKKRDDKQIADELWGAKKMNEAKAQFDAFKVLLELAAKKPKPAKTVQVSVRVKLEKMLHGGIKNVKKNRRVETLEGFVTEEHQHEVVVPCNCKELQGIVKKGVGDHHKENKPDNLEFAFRSKAHKIVHREENDLRLKRPVCLQPNAVKDPYTSVEVNGVGGRVLFLFGRNPFYHNHNDGPCILRVAVQGEAFGLDGKLKFDVDYPKMERERQPLLELVSDPTTKSKAVHSTLQKRRQRAQGRIVKCNAELAPIREPLHLGTCPSSCLHFYGNLKQPVVAAGSASERDVVQPRPLFAVVMRCPLGAKKLHRQAWEKLRKAMAPLLWPSFWMLAPVIRAIQPRSLDSAPAYFESLDAAEETAAQGDTGSTHGFFLSEKELGMKEPGQDIVKFLLRHGLGPPEGFDTSTEELPCEIGAIGREDVVEKLNDESLEDDEKMPLRPAWAILHSEPIGLPVALGPQLNSNCERAEAKSNNRYKNWTLYPRYLHRQPLPRRDTTKAKSECLMPWLKLGERSYNQKMFWLAYNYFTSAAFQDGYIVDGRGTEFNDGNQDAVGHALLRRANCLRELEQFGAALEQARHVTELAPNLGSAWSLVGVLAARMGDASEAREALFKAVELHPTDHVNVGLLQKLKAEYRGEPASAARAEKIAGNVALERDGDLGKAVAHYTCALAIMKVPVANFEFEGSDEEDARLLAEVFSNRSSAFAKLGRWKLAVADAEKILPLPGRQSWTKGHVRLGTALLAAGRCEEAYPHFARAVAALPGDASAKAPARLGREACLRFAGFWKSPAAIARSTRIRRDAGRPKDATRVFIISDIHFDHPQGDDWVYRISKHKFIEDILIVAGDVAEHLTRLRVCLKHLRAKFRRVFFTPGNHDLWVHTSEEKDIVDSIHKLFLILEICDEIDVDVFPAAICQGVSIMPLFSWYSAEFDQDDPFPSNSMIFDKFAKWPMDRDNELWRYMLYLNHRFFKLCEGDEVITFSHFLPRRDLPFYHHVPGLVKAMGCPDLDDQVRQAKSSYHVFGHSHVKCDRMKEGIQYVQNPLGYKNEHGPYEPLCCIFDGSKGGTGNWMVHPMQ